MLNALQLKGECRWHFNRHLLDRYLQWRADDFVKFLEDTGRLSGILNKSFILKIEGLFGNIRRHDEYEQFSYEDNNRFVRVELHTTEDEFILSILETPRYRSPYDFEADWKTQAPEIINIDEYFEKEC